MTNPQATVEIETNSPGMRAAAIEYARLRGSSVMDEVDQRMFGQDAMRVVRAYLTATSPAPAAEGIVERLRHGVRYMSKTALAGSDEVNRFRAFGDTIIANEGDVHTANFSMAEAASLISSLTAEIDQAWLALERTGIEGQTLSGRAMQLKVATAAAETALATARDNALEEAAQVVLDHGHSNGNIRPVNRHLAKAIASLKGVPTP